MPKDNKIERMWQFDYIKAIGIVFVIILHIAWTDTQKRFILFPFLINLAVPVFMIVSGYMNAMSCDRHKTDTVRKWFVPHKFTDRILRVLCPFTIIYLLEILAHTFMHSLQTEQLTVLDILKIYILGGWGPGAYYVPVLIQFLILFPFLYLCVRKNARFGSICLIILQLLLETGFILFGIDSKWYGFLFFRYIVFILFGILLYQTQMKIRNSYLAVLLISGAVYITFLSYFGYKPKLFPYWTTTSMPTVLWIGAILYLALKYMKPLPPLFNTGISYIGRASLHIFLVQKLWYGVGFGDCLNNTTMQIIFNVIVCITAGCTFFGIGQKLKRRDHER